VVAKAATNAVENLPNKPSGIADPAMDVAAMLPHRIRSV
jgi:hypothetical protein